MTEPYIHLSYDERKAFIRDIAEKIGSWSFARIFAECIDKTYFNPVSRTTPDEVALEQIVSRFEQYMRKCDPNPISIYGALIHDNNVTVAKRHTELMQQFHRQGTIWTSINHIIETPLFVNSELTSMVQIADLCAYVFRRYFECRDLDYFESIKKRIDKHNGKLVGIRHYTDENCQCVICQERQRKHETSNLEASK